MRGWLIAVAAMLVVAAAVMLAAAAVALEPPVDPCSLGAQQPVGPYVEGSVGKPAPVVQCVVGDVERFDLYVTKSLFGAGNLEDAREVRWCESRDNPEAVGWAADEEGLFQMHPGWTTGAWNPGLIPAFDGFDPWLNTWFASVLWDAEGWGQWSCASIVGVS